MHFLKRTGIVCLLLFFLLISISADAQLIISQYYEGLANDKFIEITNTSSIPFDPENNTVFICVYSNENASNPEGTAPGLYTQITDLIPAGESLVYKNGLATSPTYAVESSIGSLIGAFNGNDLILISSSRETNCWENRIDVIGEPSDWGIDISFVRDPAKFQPSVMYNAADWISFNLNDVENANDGSIERLGNHIFDCIIPDTPVLSPNIQSISDESATIGWQSGNGSGSIAILEESFFPHQPPLNATNYVANNLFSQGDQIGDGYVVYNGWENEVTIQGLSPDTEYRITFYEHGCIPPHYLINLPATTLFRTLPPITRIDTDLPEIMDLGVVDPAVPADAIPFTIQWENLNIPIHVEVSGLFEVSNDNESFTNHFTISPQPDGNQLLWCRFSPEVSDGIHSEELIISAGTDPVIEVNLIGTAKPIMWVNEFHYEDQGADDDEFVEIVLMNAAFYELSELFIQLYNGATGNVYQQTSVDELVPGEEQNGFQVFTWFTSNIQNGGIPEGDGIGLGINNLSLELISYEGEFIATDGISIGLISENIGLQESDEFTAEGTSIQLENESSMAMNSTTGLKTFQWNTGNSSPGAFNSNQSLPVEWDSFHGEIELGGIGLYWKTLSEFNNKVFIVERSGNGKNFNQIGLVPASNSTGINNYYFFDPNPIEKAYYRLKQIDFDGNAEYSNTIVLSYKHQPASRLEIFPQPVYKKINIRWNSSDENDLIYVGLYGIDGKKILESRADLTKIIHLINEQLPSLQKGMYILEMSDNNQRKRNILLKE